MIRPKFWVGSKGYDVIPRRAKHLRRSVAYWLRHYRNHRALARDHGEIWREYGCLPAIPDHTLTFSPGGSWIGVCRHYALVMLGEIE